MKLRNAVCCRLTLFNGRRGGQAARLTIRQWQDRAKWTSDSALTSLDEFDQEMVKNMDITYQPGKGNHLVPCLVPKDCKAALNKLCDPETRRGIISDSNIYVFANTEGSDNHVVGTDTIMYMCNMAGVSNVSATTNREMMEMMVF